MMQWLAVVLAFNVDAKSPPHFVAASRFKPASVQSNKPQVAMLSRDLNSERSSTVDRIGRISKEDPPPLSTNE